MFPFNIKRLIRESEIKISRRINALAWERELENKALYSTTSGVSEPRDTQLIVSLTTFNRRIQNVHKTIESLFSQTVKADKILLWVCEEDYDGALPEILKLQEKRGLEVRFCEHDLGPYKKYHYTLLEYPDSLIITADDDTLYPLDFIEQLYQANLSQPDIVHCHRAHKISLDGNGMPEPYKRWDLNTSDTEASAMIFPTGVCGVIYFPGCFAPEINDAETFLKLCPKADDVWLKAMTHKNGVISKKIIQPNDHNLRFQFIDGSQQVSLKRVNKIPSTGNDAKFKAVIDHFNLTFT